MSLAAIPRRAAGRPPPPFRLVALPGLVRSLDNPASLVGEGFTGAAAGSVAGRVVAIAQVGGIVVTSLVSKVAFFTDHVRPPKGLGTPI